MSAEVNIPKAHYFKTEIETANRNFGLDLARTICILSIVLLHTNNFMGDFLSYKLLGQPGFMLQELVFALSGFLIGKQLLVFNNSKNGFKALVGFYRNRWLRTIPFYFIFLIINLCLFYLYYSNIDKDYLRADFNPLRYFLFLQNFSSSHPYFYPEMWPLPIEEWSYLLIPAVLLVIRAVFKKCNLLLIIVLMILIAIGCRTVYLMQHSVEFDWDVRKVVLMRLDALLYGFVVRLLIEQYGKWFDRNKSYLVLSCLCICIIAFFTRSHRNEWWYASLYFVMVPAVFALSIPYFYYSAFARVGNVLKKIITHISLVSYAMLLSHLYFIQFLMLQIYEPKSGHEGVIFGLIYFVILIAFSTLFFNFIERPLLKLRKRKMAT